MTSRLTILLSAVTLAVIPLAATAATLHVGPGQTYATIQAAVNAAGTDDTIVIHDGTYVESITVSTRVSIVSQDFLDNGEYDSAIIDPGADYTTAMTVNVGGVSVEGLSFTGVTIFAYGIYLVSAPNCYIANNRFGWDLDHWVETGVYLQESNACLIEHNSFGSGSAGVYIDQCMDTQVRHNTFQDVDALVAAAGVILSGTYDIYGRSNCQRNAIYSNNFISNSMGVYASGYVWRNTIAGNTFSDNMRGIFLGPGGLMHNVVSGNILTNNGINMVLDGASYNTIVDNTLNGQGTGIWIGWQSPYTGNYNLIMFNSIWNHELGMWIGGHATDNRIAANSFVGNTVNVEAHTATAMETDVVLPEDWNTSTPLSYFHGDNHRNYLGNYYDTYTGTDTDGDGVGDTGLPFDDGDALTGPVENYPLVSPPDQYAIEAWYLEADSLHTMYHRDMARPGGEWEIAGSEQTVWTSAQAANGDVSYASGTWTGRINLDWASGPGAFTIEIGSSSNGTDFTASGLQASIGEGTENLFETSAAALTVPDGHYLAVRLTNNTEWAFQLSMGGLTCYISSPGINDPEWPGTVTSVDEATPSQLVLHQNYPNPFNPTTTIAFSLPHRTEATLRVYDVLGRTVATLASGPMEPGPHQVEWDGRNHQGEGVSSGVYFYRLVTSQGTETRKMVLMK